MRTARGRILRDTAVGDGLIAVDGAQHPFRLEGLWKSEHAPKVDMQVDVDFDDRGNIVAIRAVDQAAVAREQAAKLAAQAGVAAKQAGEAAKAAAAELQAKGLPVLKRYADIVGIPTLAAMACVLVGWFFLAAVSIEFFGDAQSATFYELMRVLNDPENGLGSLAGQVRSGAGLYGFLTIVALLAPLVPHFLRSRRAWLAYCAPLAWMVLAVLIGYWKVSSGISAAQRQLGGFGDAAGGMAREFLSGLSEAISIGFGVYLAVAAGAYLAFVGVRRYRGGARTAETLASSGV
jgi:hypothetical protein